MPLIAGGRMDGARPGSARLSKGAADGCGGKRGASLLRAQLFNANEEASQPSLQT